MMNIFDRIMACWEHDRIIRDQRATIQDLYNQRTEWLHTKEQLYEALYSCKDWNKFEAMAREILKKESKHVL